MDPPAFRKIVILGGGSAGWIAANAMVASWASTGVEISLVESPDIGTVGVGEGSTPRLRHFFNAIGVPEFEWMPQCSATYKNGISFVNWSSKPGFERYYHPFPSRTDEHTAGAFYFNARQRIQGRDVHAHPDRFFLSAKLSEQRMGPLPNESFPFDVEYGYHFDAHLVGEFLKRKAVSRGVRHIEANVRGVNQAANGDIESLVAEHEQVIEGDFFVDCSGFRGALIQETLEVPFRSFAENLFNDAAVVLPTPQLENIASQTISTALKNGWLWEIPLTHRIGNGYVYSSAFCSADAAEKELRDELGLLDNTVEARHLSMKVGRVEQHWQNNCLAVGLSQGFIEPLEATALNIVCSTIDDFIGTVNAEGFSGAGKESFNARINQKFERVRDYIVTHYKLNSRDDSEYWRANRENKVLSEPLQKIFDCWQSGKQLELEFGRQKIPASYAPMSWYCIFAGYGHYPELAPQASTDGAENQVDMAEIDEFIRRCALNFRPQNALLQDLSDQGASV